MKHCTHWIGGKPWDGAAGRHGDIYDPATGQVTGTVDYASTTVVGDAVAAAAKAFGGWRGTSLAKRTQILFAFRELVRAHQHELAALISSEHGKVASDAAGEVARGLEVAEFACGIGHLLKGGFSENVSTGVDAYSIRQPLGVVAGITPFNFPAMVPMWMYPIAIACGNTFILKPSEKDPSCPLRLAELFTEAGLPDGVFNVINGAQQAVGAVAREELVPHLLAQRRFRRQQLRREQPLDQVVVAAVGLPPRQPAHARDWARPQHRAARGSLPPQPTPRRAPLALQDPRPERAPRPAPPSTARTPREAAASRTPAPVIPPPTTTRSTGPDAAASSARRRRSSGTAPVASDVAPLMPRADAAGRRPTGPRSCRRPGSR